MAKTTLIRDCGTSRLVICQYSQLPHEISDDCQRVADAIDAYGMCVVCGRRARVFCICGTTFAERARSVIIDRAALRKIHGS